MSNLWKFCRKLFGLQASQVVAAEPVKKLRAKRPLPPRDEQIKSLQKDQVFDVLIIGGGATGAGCALDAVTRGKNMKQTQWIDFKIIQNNLNVNIYLFIFISNENA